MLKKYYNFLLSSYYSLVTVLGLNDCFILLWEIFWIRINWQFFELVMKTSEHHSNGFN